MGTTISKVVAWALGAAGSIGLYMVLKALTKNVDYFQEGAGKIVFIVIAIIIALIGFYLGYMIGEAIMKAVQARKEEAETGTSTNTAARSSSGGVSAYDAS